MQTSTEMHDELAQDRGAAPPEPVDRHHLGLTALLLLVWVVFSFGAGFFARDLQAWFPGWELGYWVAAQGSVLMFMALVYVYCVCMQHFERQGRTPSGSPPPDDGPQ